MSSKRESLNFFKGLSFISPWLVGFLAFTLLPIGLSLYFSLCDYSLLQTPVFRGLENYRYLWNDSEFWKSLRNTMYYAVLSLPAGLLVALGCALLLNTKIKGQSIYRTIIFTPSLVPLVASAVLWLWIFNTRYGLINSVLFGIGVHNPPGWLSDVKWAMPSLAIMGVWGVGNTVIIFLAGLQDVPTDLYEAAELDGATALKQLIHVTIPSISPIIFFNLVIGLIGTMQIFVPALVMTQGGPVHATYFYTYLLYDDAFSYLRMGQASAMAWIQLMIILGLTGIVFWSSKHWVHQQGN